MRFALTRDISFLTLRCSFPLAAVQDVRVPVRHLLELFLELPHLPWKCVEAGGPSPRLPLPEGLL